MAAGEWFVKLVSPAFGEERPAPLTMHSLPIVSGHPESEEPLTDAEHAAFEEEVLPEVIERTEEEYGLDVPSHEDAMDYSGWGEVDREIGSPPGPAPEGVDLAIDGDADGDSNDNGDGGGSDSDDVRDAGMFDEADDGGADGAEDDSDATSGPDGVGDTRTDDEPADVSTGSEFFSAQDDTDDCPVDDVELRQRGLSRDDAIFLKRVLDAMNRDLDSYSLLEGMDELTDDLDGLDVGVLLEQGLIEKGKVDRRPYYTVLPDGQELLDETVTVEPGTGDLGEKTPHKVGVELLVQWFDTLDEIDRIERYYKHDAETTFDVAGFDSDGALVWAGEVEMASNNTETVVTDYDKMAAVDANTIWAFPTRTEGQDTIGKLADTARLPNQVSGRAARSFSPFQQAVEEFEADGMTTVQTFRKLYEEVEE